MKQLLVLSCLTCFFAFGQEDSYLSNIGVLNKKTWSLRDSAIINRLNKTALDSSSVNPKKDSIIRDWHIAIQGKLNTRMEEFQV